MSLKVELRCLAFASQIMQLRAMCHKHPNSSSFHGCHAVRLHYVFFSGIWGGVESKGLKFEFEKWNLLLSLVFACEAQANFSSEAVTGEANPPFR